jgi:hypothetical protein
VADRHSKTHRERRVERAARRRTRSHEGRRRGQAVSLPLPPRGYAGMRHAREPPSSTRSSEGGARQVRRLRARASCMAGSSSESPRGPPPSRCSSESPPQLLSQSASCRPWYSQKLPGAPPGTRRKLSAPPPQGTSNQLLRYAAGHPRLAQPRREPHGEPQWETGGTGVGDAGHGAGNPTRSRGGAEEEEQQHPMRPIP